MHVDGGRVGSCEVEKEAGGVVDEGGARELKWCEFSVSFIYLFF